MWIYAIKDVSEQKCVLRNEALSPQNEGKLCKYSAKDEGILRMWISEAVFENNPSGSVECKESLGFGSILAHAVYCVSCHELCLLCRPQASYHTAFWELPNGQVPWRWSGKGKQSVTVCSEGLRNMRGLSSVQGSQESSCKGWGWNWIIRKKGFHWRQTII